MNKIKMNRIKNIFLEMLGLLWYPNISKNMDDMKDST